jgi:hypothetical protein
MSTALHDNTHKQHENDNGDSSPGTSMNEEIDEKGGKSCK